MSSVAHRISTPARVFGVEPLSARVLKFVLQASTDFSWTPGQHVKLTAEGAVAGGYYSIASAPRRQEPGSFELAIAIDALPEGVAAEPGTAVTLSPAQGDLPLEDLRSATDVVLVGMGTGVAPLRAVVQALLASAEGPSVTLVQGARTADDCLFRDEFQAVVGERFAYRPVLSRADEAWTGLRGRVQDHIRDLPASARFCVCGSSEMVGQVAAVLSACGVAAGQVFSEGY